MNNGNGTMPMTIDLSDGYGDNANLLNPPGLSQNVKKKEPLKTRIAKHLDYLSGVIFFAAFLISKPQYLPHPLISSISKLIGLCGYLLGYFLWFVSTLFYDHHDRLEKKWYGFAEFKDQFQVTSIIGLVATVLCLVFPVLILPATCLFAISNILWLIGEHHRNNTPNLPGPPLSSAAKNHYFNYVKLITTVSVIAAVGMTIAFFFPVIAAPVMTVTTILGIGLSLIAMIFLIMKSCAKKPVQETVAIPEAGDLGDKKDGCQDELSLSAENQLSVGGPETAPLLPPSAPSNEKEPEQMYSESFQHFPSPIGCPNDLGLEKQRQTLYPRDNFVLESDHDASAPSM